MKTKTKQKIQCTWFPVLLDGAFVLAVQGMFVWMGWPFWAHQYGPFLGGLRLAIHVLFVVWVPLQPKATGWTLALYGLTAASLCGAAMMGIPAIPPPWKLCLELVAPILSEISIQGSAILFLFEKIRRWRTR